MLALSLLLVFGFSNPGSHSDYEDYLYAQEQRGVDAEEYQYLFNNCRALMRYLNAFYPEESARYYIAAYLFEVDTHTSWVLLRDMVLNDFDI